MYLLINLCVYVYFSSLETCVAVTVAAIDQILNEMKLNKTINFLFYSNSL